MIENFQARYLVRNPLNFDVFHGVLDNADCKRSRLSVMSEDARYLFDKTYVREQSIAALSGLDVVGTTDNLETFLAEFARAARFDTADGATAVPRENVATGVDQEPWSEQVLETIRRLTTLDHELFELARSRSQPGSAARNL